MAGMLYVSYYTVDTFSSSCLLSTLLMSKLDSLTNTWSALRIGACSPFTIGAVPTVGASTPEFVGFSGSTESISVSQQQHYLA